MRRHRRSPEHPWAWASTAGTIQLTWSASSDDSGPLLDYLIYRDGDPSPIGQVTSTSTTTVGFTDPTCSRVDLLVHGRGLRCREQPERDERCLRTGHGPDPGHDAARTAGQAERVGHAGGGRRPIVDRVLRRQRSGPDLPGLPGRRRVPDRADHECVDHNRRLHRSRTRQGRAAHLHRGGPRRREQREPAERTVRSARGAGHGATDEAGKARRIEHANGDDHVDVDRVI